MKKIDLGQSVQIVANLGVIAGLIFLAFEVRTNTATNQIAIYQAASANWMQINSTIATDEELVALLEKASSGQALTNIEARQFNGWVSEFLTQGAFVRRLFEGGLLTEAEFTLEIRGLRDLAQEPRAREIIERIPTGGFRDLILADEEEFARLLREPGALEVGP